MLQTGDYSAFRDLAREVIDERARCQLEALADVLEHHKSDPRRALGLNHNKIITVKDVKTSYR